ncbi:MAG: alpha/beta fold hydrolase [Pirellulales bacterium]|nr:alpha/beta fold hydrolase [Pirellulales bacterium]
MFVELVQVTTDDGVRLDGMLQAADEEVAGSALPLGIDAVVMVHGTGGNFYASTMMELLAECLRKLGAATLRVNTRGHDGISTAVTRTGGIRQGAAYEVVDDCRHDLAAWLDLAQARGYRSVALLGHSLGAVKSIYALAQAGSGSDDTASGRPRSVTRLIVLSPPRLSYSYFAASPRAEEFLAMCRQAEELVAAGRDESLVEISFPLPYAVTARGYLDKYGPAERYNVLKHLPTISCPTLVTFGSIEVQTNVAFRGMPEAVEALPAAADGASRSLALIAGADHFYSGTRAELAARVESWLRKQSQTTRSE